MKKTGDNFYSMKQEIESAIKILDDKFKTSPKTAHVGKSGLAKISINETDSLIDRCQQIVYKKVDARPNIRVVHHLACSGGTLVSKCIDSLPNVFVLSEAHPNSKLITASTISFAPSDIVSLSKLSGIPNLNSISKDIFKYSISNINKHLKESGATLVVRYHTHSDYNVGDDTSDKNVFEDYLSDSHNVLSLLTIRNPIDSYYSLKQNGWVHFSPQSFNEYCRRYLIHLSHFDTEQILRYEDFVASPQTTMKSMCNLLELRYDDSFVDTFSVNKLTGDSGRKSDVISARARRADDALLEEAEQSEFYQQICDDGWY